MNAYDFDGTIYNGESQTDFFIFLIKDKKKIYLLNYLPGFLFDLCRFGLKIIDRKKLKENFYKFLTSFGDGELDTLVKEFWDKKGLNKIFGWYKGKQDINDVVISASPKWLLSYVVCENLGIKTLICTEIDKKTGKFDGENCYGDEKVNRFYKYFPDGKINEFYSDSYSDTPLAKIADKAYMVSKNGDISLWELGE